MRHFLLLPLIAVSASALAQPSTPPAAQPAANKDKLICKRETPVGSLIASRKRCMTKEEWTRMEQEQNEIARKFVYDNTSRSSGN
ncbi:hypothetical protein HJG53_11830 [Sphingomonas sp. ID1715]|uniref:hypothetical protein n=1 Tax=Sphingomonas sp. ID1715 TaxID=1656898 RepID=UPI0014888F7A|nr:hypothetical protein [Sphingomonas sp. ID1715]NNM77599.1 hypothetical protein [Sphingomonas sp. ID1715]